jgi:galactosamine-6-phosphate isomerase
MPTGFRVVVEDDHEAMSRRAADWIAASVLEEPDLLLCVASGATPTRAYDLFAEEGRARPETVRRLRILRLDEWGGLPADDPGSSEFQIRRQLAEPLAVPPSRYFAFRGDSADPQAECARIRRVVEEQGPIGLAVLGLGVNGHLGFNEPAEALQPHAHVAELSQASREHSMLASARGVPQYGLTLGMADLLRAQRVLLVVSGAHKRDVLAGLVSGGITTSLPGSFLRMHPDALCLCDRDAAAALGSTAGA